MSDYENDIPLDVARAAHLGTSHVPDERAAQDRASYAATLRADLDALLKLAADDEAKLARLDEEFKRYRVGLASHTLAYLYARSRCMSAMIVGPAKFPTSRNEKANASEDKRRAELLEFRKRALAAIRKALCPETAPIMSGDEDAVERLQEKIAEAEKRQALMKAANAAIRKHAKAGPEAQVAALVALGISEETALSRLLKPDFAGRIGFPDYETKNNAANIRRMKARLAGLKRDKATPSTAIEGKHGVLQDSPAGNRVRVWFPTKPAREVRERLKAASFRWAPTVAIEGMDLPRPGVWQAYRNPGSLEVARREAGLEKGATS